MLERPSHSHLKPKPSARSVVALPQVATWPGAEVEFEMDPFTRECLLRGWDSVGLVLRHDAEIAAYEERRSELLPQTL